MEGKEAIEKLLKQRSRTGLDINGRDDYGMTPLKYASAGGNTEKKCFFVKEIQPRSSSVFAPPTNVMAGARTTT